MLMNTGNAFANDAYFTQSSDKSAVVIVTELPPTTSGPLHILVVEDEPKACASISEGLQLQGWDVATAGTGIEAAACIERQSFDLIVLDWMLPGRDGMSVLADMRQRGIQTPVLILTARDSVEDRVTGLENGADDYLVKPFAFAELLARCRALLRRLASNPAAVLTCDDLQLDLRARIALRSGQEISLTPREVDVLEYLFRFQGQVVTREMLQRDVWKQSKRFTSLDNVIDVQMTRLRRKVDGETVNKLIHTLRGIGYRLGKEPV